MNAILRGVSDRQMRDMLDYLEHEGCELSLTGKQHVRVRYQGRVVGVTSYTTSDHRAYMRARSEFRRAVPDLMGKYTK